jgi:hypothetical protein
MIVVRMVERSSRNGFPRPIDARGDTRERRRWQTGAAKSASPLSFARHRILSVGSPECGLPDQRRQIGPGEVP